MVRALLLSYIGVNKFLYIFKYHPYHTCGTSSLTLYTLALIGTYEIFGSLLILHFLQIVLVIVKTEFLPDIPSETNSIIK